jgi:ubiquitin-protein ligase
VTARCAILTLLALALQVYHPNIDWEGHVCLNILRADWRPVLSLNSVIYGIMTLFLVCANALRCAMMVAAVHTDPIPYDALNALAIN